MKLTNRRIRLVLAVFAFAFLAMFARAAWPLTATSLAESGQARALTEHVNRS